jgi:hypothetical protein
MNNELSLEEIKQRVQEEDEEYCENVYEYYMVSEWNEIEKMRREIEAMSKWFAKRVVV